MTAATQQPALPASTSGPPPGGGPPGDWRRWLGGRPTVGVGPAGKAVAEDVSALVKAEIALAKAELLAGIKPKAMGIGAFVGAAVLGWLGLQGLLITLGFLLALVMPGWVAALLVTLLLLVGAAVAAFIGKKKFETPVSLDTTKTNVEEDVAWTKAHLPSR